MNTRAPVDAPASAPAVGSAGPGPATAASRAARKRTAQDGDDDAEASLRKRMAGPSSGKAGLAADQDEINRKIYEASRGSKFFENERIKDAETTQRINALLVRRDDALSRVPVDSSEWLAIGKKVDVRLAELEATRDLSRQICHVDADQFYAAVELKRDPTLKGKAFGVGSGVLTTASYEARQKGCRSGQAVFVAKALCPELIVVKNDFAAYVQASSEIMEILGSYDENLQPASLDEAYLDITDYCAQHQMTAEQVVTQLRKEIQEETGLTVSVGIAANKTLAKICSDRNKPNGQYKLTHDRDSIMQFMDGLPVRKIPGIGRVTERILSAVNVKTCGDIWKYRHELYLTFGSSLDQLLSAYLGLGSTHVRPNDRRERKSVGRETTFRPTSDLEKLKEELRGCADQVEKDLERNYFKGRTVTLVAKKDTFQRFTRAKSGTAYLNKADDLYNITVGLLMAEVAELERSSPNTKLSLRLIGVRVTQLKDLQPPDNQIKKLFEAVGSKPSAQGQGDKSMEALEEEQLQEALRLSLIEATPAAGDDTAASRADTTVASPLDSAETSKRPRVERNRSGSIGLARTEQLNKTPPKRPAERTGPQVTASSFSPPRPKAPEKAQGLSFANRSTRPQPPAAQSQPTPNDTGSKGRAIPHSSPCPICQLPLSYWSNAELNTQIDDCLEGRGHQPADTHGSRSTKTPGRASGSPVRQIGNPEPSADRGRDYSSARKSSSSGVAAEKQPNGRAPSTSKDATREKSRQTGGAGPLDMWLSKKRASS
ncbi:hypothetical protein OC834_005579 [Tilletia horrida]|uniref:DNA polymerase kappa n=1 Tax=Tilletia horrida TaxID=155126 RepID=A0AAN6GJG2_9BASI|nr:hypothetical protein OC834_005579 [Tilletia horrida]KAK0540552.1 hypothetical protein OC842_000407 [Tilletia horrida]